MNQPAISAKPQLGGALTERGWRELSVRMSERKAKPEASFAAAAINGKEADPWRVGIVGWFDVRCEATLDISDKWVRFFQPDPRSS